MFNSSIEEIKNRLDIVEVIGEYIKLQKVGANYRAICPFHSEKKPSFFVSPARQIWHCFGSCSEGGDIFKFIMKIEGVEFGDALRILAKKAGVELKRQDPKIKTERQRLYEICELSSQFFERQLKSGKIGKQAQNYLRERGINDESIEKWRLGYAPDTWQGLSDFLVGRGYKREEIVKAGLAVKKEKRAEDSPPPDVDGRGQSSAIYDRFRARIMFPIFDLNSQVIAFGGRVFGKKAKDEIAKYINSPITLLYDKSRILYGLDKARVAIRKEDKCILVEGYIDVIMSHQAGIENVVATSGTALTPWQLTILKRYSDNLLTAFDMDIAGGAATKRGIDLAQTKEFNIKVAIMPKDKDPADIILENAKLWHKLINNPYSILDFYFKTALERFDKKTPEGKEEIAAVLLPVIRRITNRITRAHWIGKLAKELEVKEQDIETELKRTSHRFDKAIESRINRQEPEIISADNKKRLQNNKGRKEVIEERIVSLILKFPQNLALIDEEFLSYFSSPIQEILISFKKNPNPDILGNLKKYKFSSPVNELLNELSLKAELEKGESKGLKTEFLTCLKELQSMEIKSKLDEISKKLKQAEEKKNSQQVEELIQKFNKLTNLLYEKKEKVSQKETTV